MEKLGHEPGGLKAVGPAGDAARMSRSAGLPALS